MLSAAQGVFLRFGYRKTSMDEVARAAGLSRQGLYLHFATKQELFHAVVTRMVDAVRTAALAALERADLSVPERLLRALTTLAGDAGGLGGGAASDLLRAADAQAGPLLDQARTEIVAAMAALLERSGAAAPWRDAGLTATDLAEHLYLLHPAVARSGEDPARQRERLAVAVRIVTRGRTG
jgi:AcrR family transcriptional regulator